MSQVHKVSNAVVHQPLRDLLGQLLSMSLAKRDIGSVTASDVGLRTSTAASYTIGGKFYSKAASSAVWALSGDKIAASKHCKFGLLLNSFGDGAVTQGDIVDTAAAAEVGDIASTEACVGEILIQTGAAEFVPGTTTFSQCISAGGSVTVTEYMHPLAV